MPTTADPGSRWRRPVAVVAGIAITGALLYWVFSGVSFADVARHLRAARPLPLLLAVVLATSSFLIRALRSQVLLRAEDGGPVPFRSLWHATAMGFMASNTLPFRLGELVRSYAMSRLGKVPMATALSSIAVERALDGLTLVGLLLVALLGAGLPGDTVILGNRLDALARKSAIVCAIIFAGALVVVLFPRLSERVIRTVIPWRKLSDKLVAIVEGLRLGFGALKSPARLTAAVVWSVIHWLIGGLSFWIAFRAFGIDVGYAGALLVQSLLAFGVAAQLTPGFFGQFEVLVAAALTLFGVPEDLGIAYALTYHVTTFLPIVLLGLLSMVRTGLHVRDARTAAG